MSLPIDPSGALCDDTSLALGGGIVLGSYRSAQECV